VCSSDLFGEARDKFARDQLCYKRANGFGKTYNGNPFQAQGCQSNAGVGAAGRVQNYHRSRADPAVGRSARRPSCRRQKYTSEKW